MMNTVYPAHLVAEHRLEDGTALTIRPIRPEDADMEREFVNGLSAQSRYGRFMYAMKEISPQMVSRFTRIDYDRDMALIAVVRDGGRERQIAVARFARSPDATGCEFAIVVADAWQHRGVARELLKRLIRIARDRGLKRMDGITLRSNRGMLALAGELGFEERRSPEDPDLVMMSLVLD